MRTALQAVTQNYGPSASLARHNVTHPLSEGATGMTNPNQASQWMIDNLPQKTAAASSSGLSSSMERTSPSTRRLMNHLKQVHGVSHGFANGIVLRYRERGSAPSNDDALVEPQYSGAKAALRPIYDAIVAAVTDFGADVEVAPKRTGVSLRRSKQFAVVEAASAKRRATGNPAEGGAGDRSSARGERDVLPQGEPHRCQMWMAT